MSDKLHSSSSVIEGPTAIADASQIHWDDEVDVLIVGFGGAGAAAAIEASDLGCEVLIFDRFGGGGATALSGGIHYAGGTSIQHAAGVTDSAEEMYKYLRLEVGDAVSDETLRQFCNDSAGNIEWLKDLGVEFGGGIHSGKTVYPPDGKFLYYSGNEALPAYASKADPAVRGHRVVGKGYTGHVYFAAMKAAVESRSIPVKTHTRVVRLILDQQGRALGVEALALPEGQHKTHDKLFRKAGPMPFNFATSAKAMAKAREMEETSGQRIRIRARHGVILATGGFCFNNEMLEEHMPHFARFAPAMLRMGSMGCDGSGILLGQSAGGAVRKMENNFYGRIISPPTALTEGSVVNRQGRRFYNEDAYNAELGGAIALQEEGIAWLILDQATWRKLRAQLWPKGDGQFMQWYLPALINILFGGTRKAATLEGLAKKCNISAGGLKAEARSEAENIAAGKGDPLGKSDKYYHALGDGPYHAINLAVWNKFVLAPFLTLGGLAIDEGSGIVINEAGKPIPGLYAIGRAAIGICANRYLSGMSLADGVFSGRRAARDCAAAKQSGAHGRSHLVSSSVVNGGGDHAG